MSRHRVVPVPDRSPITVNLSAPATLIRAEAIMRIPTIGLLAAFIPILSGCAGTPPTPTAPAIDWSQAPVARLRYAVGFFHPQRLELALNRPVRLIFENGGGMTHDFVTGFFATVAQRPPGQAPAGQVPGGQLLGKQAGGARVILQPAESVEYDIVPQKPGDYVVQTVMLAAGGGIPPATLSVR